MQIDSNQTLTVPTQALINVTSFSGTSGFLRTIGASNNRYVLLKATAGHTIVILADGSGNINSLDSGYIWLTGNAQVMLFCHNGQWAVIGATNIGYTGVTPPNTYTKTTDPTPGDDVGDGYLVGSVWLNVTADREWILVDATANVAIWKRVTPPKNRWSIRAAGAAALGIGVANPTTANAPAAANDSVNTYITLPSTAVIANLGGWVTTVFTLLRPAQDPIIEIYVKTDSVNTTERLWVGIISADITNVDDPAAGTKFIGFRYSTNAADTGWVPVLDDGTTMSVGIAMGGVVGVLPNSTAFKLRIRIVSGGTPTAYFSVNDNTEQAMTANFPAIATDMGAVCRAIPLAASIRLINFSSFDVAIG